MAITIKKEISLGQIGSIALILATVVGTGYALSTRVADLEKHQEINEANHVSRNEITLMQENIQKMSDDIREIRNALIDEIRREQAGIAASSRKSTSKDSVGRKP